MLADERQNDLVKEFNISPSSGATISANMDLYKTFPDAARFGYQNFGIATATTANMMINKKVNYINVTPEEIAKQIANLAQVTDVDEDKLNEIINKVLSENPKAVEDFKKGKETVIMFLVGQVMRQFPEKIDSGKVKESLLSKLK
jgi:Asp-tRNA(Asn)/Glu-tRNA(Gln) amidotransferase B subunit